MPSVGYLGLLIIAAAVGTVVLVASLFATNPLTIGPVGVTVWFLVLLATIISVVTLGLYFLKLFLHIHSTSKARLRYSWRQGLLIGGGLVALAALSSLQQLGLRDAILLGLLLIIVELYVRFRWP